MIYQGRFADAADSRHTLKITTGWSPSYNASNDTTTAITMGETPFITTMDSGDDTIYKPMKCTGATIQIVTEGYLFDIYSATAQGTKVELRGSSNQVEWVGFATPNLYDMGYQAIETIEIECIDGLSTLQYIKYTPVGASKTVRSFAEIVGHIISQCHCYVNWNFPVCTSVPGTSGAIMDNLYISEQNFFEAKSDDRKTDADTAWTCQEVLEQIAQYLGCSVMARGNVVYFVDYDMLKVSGGTTRWHTYTVGSSAAPSSTTRMETPFAIEHGTHYDGSAGLSMGDVFNKVTVKCTLNDYDDVLPDFFDGAVNITKDDPNMECPKTTTNNIGDDSVKMYGATIESTIGNTSGDPNTKMLAFVDANGNADNSRTFEAPTWLSGVFIRYMHNPNIVCHRYLYNGTTWDDVTSDYPTLCYTDTLALSGAFMVRSEVLWMREASTLAKYSEQAMHYDDIAKFINDLTDEESSEISSRLDMDDYILLVNPLAGQPNYSGASTEHMWETTDYPYVETELTDTSMLYGGDNAYYVISGGVLWDGATKNSNYPIDCSNEKIDINNGRKDISQPMAYLRCKLQQGDKWWNGQQWTTTESIFKVYFVKENTEELRADAMMFKELNIVNTVTWDMGLEATGYAIPVPGVMSGTPKLTILNPMDFGGASPYQARLLAIKNLKLRAVIGDPSYSGSLDTDTEYTNVINPDYVSEAQELEFKICTWDKKKPNYSCVASWSGDGYAFVDKLANSALTSDARSVTCYHGDTGEVSTGTLRAEEWMVLRMTKQYSQPSKVFTASIKGTMSILTPTMLFTSQTLGCTFIADKMEFDVKRRKCEVKLVEKL